jgi:hypothetical protein
MCHSFYLAGLLSIILVLSSAAAYGSMHATVTTIILNQVPKSGHLGEELKITGRLIETSTGEGIVNAKLTVIDNSPSGQTILASAKTRKHGFFVATWQVTMDDPRDTTQHLVVKYKGSANYTASVSREHGVSIKRLPLEITFMYLKSYYKQGERAEIIFTATSMRKPVEPDALYASFNGSPVDLSIYGKGNYVYETEPLSKGHNQFFVSASKHGYETISRVITITVIGS